MLEVSNVGVLGAGVMGRGVAQSLAQAGYRVILLDLAPGILEKARESIRQNLRFGALFQGSEPAQDPEKVLGLITCTTDETSLSGVDFVIENVPEKWEVKRAVFIRLDAVCPPHCILASDTSAMPITRIASLTQRPEKVIGIHFMNPVPLKPVVELVCGEHTSQETLQATRDLLARMGKECILVNDSPGFVSNRVLMLTINESITLVQEGVAPARQVDRLFKTCFGHKMGPLETADLIGLDTVLYSLEVLRESFRDSKFESCRLLREMVEAGRLGQKSGQGFYDYPTGDISSR